ncbi:MAG: leucine-rich repeat domain-containing protein [Clostridia bacterium]|nr:leucine-rich repeat domain-containing protein [Clostridia bacterium]
MKKMLACALALLVLIMLTPPAAFAESGGPKPTLPPTKVADGGVPFFRLNVLEGADAAKWKEVFFSYTEEHGVPVEEGGFACVTEWSRRDAYEAEALLMDEPDIKGLDSVDRMHRVMAGGAEVFLQEVDDTTAVQFTVLLDYDLSMPDIFADALRYYFPLVMRACIYASEPGATEDEVERIQKELCPDISRLVQYKLEVEARAEGEAARYYFGTDDFSFTGVYAVTFNGYWEEGSPEDDDVVRAQTSVAAPGDSLSGIGEASSEEERTDSGGQWKYVPADGGATITGYVEGPAGDLVIPGELDGVPVTGIGDWVFAGCTGLTSVTLPEGLTYLGDYAFASCPNLTDIIIPDSVAAVITEEGIFTGEPPPG